MVSVIVPNYCHARFLDQRIQSILNQTYQDFELIILDDCSPDNGASRAIIEKYRDNPHVSHIVYNEENSGSPFKQWDKGIKLAKGDLIWIAESDDFCEEKLLATLVDEFISNRDLVLAYTLSLGLFEEEPYLRKSQKGPNKTVRLSGIDFVRRYMLCKNHCVNASACLFKKDVYWQINHLFISYRASGDWLFWIEIALHGKVAIICNRLNYFRQHSQNVTQKSFENGIILKELKTTYQFVLENVRMSRFRRWLLIKNARYLLERMKFRRESIREDLIQYWGLPNKLSLFEITVIRVVRVLQNCNIYL